MRIFLVFFFSFFAIVSIAQEECEVAFISEHYVLNQTDVPIIISVDNINQASFPTEEPTDYLIAPGEKKEVGNLEWAGTFKNPTEWYVFSSSTVISKDLNDPLNWYLKILSDTKGVYIFTLNQL